MARVERLGTCVHTHKDGHKVFAVVENDINSKKVAVNLYVEYADGSVSDIYSMQRKDVVKKMNSFGNIFENIEGNFEDCDIAKIREKVRTLVVTSDKSDSMVHIETQSRATLKEIQECICEFIIERMNDDERVFLEDNYGCMETTVMDEFLKCNKDLGYKRIELLKRLKIMGLLKVSNGRPYDYLESVNGKKVRVYKVDLSDVMETFMEILEESTASETTEKSEVTEDGNQTI